MQCLRKLTLVVSTLALILPLTAIRASGQQAESVRGRTPPRELEERASAINEEVDDPRIVLSREGHADVNAKRRSFSWKIDDPDGLAGVSIRIVLIESVTMKPTELFRSDNPEGMVDLDRFGRGPGLYALLAVAKDKGLNEAKAGLRLAYTEVRKDCPEAKAWWPGRE